MSSHFNCSFQNSRHFVAVCLVLMCCYQITAATGGVKENHVKVQKLSHKNGKTATRREDNPLYDALSKIIPEDAKRLNVPSNYLTVVLNASGVLGLGFLWIKEITNAIGTPILAPILMPPLLLLSAALLLIPDLSRLGELIDNIM